MEPDGCVDLIILSGMVLFVLAWVFMAILFMA